VCLAMVATIGMERSRDTEIPTPSCVCECEVDGEVYQFLIGLRAAIEERDRVCIADPEWCQLVFWIINASHHWCWDCPWGCLPEECVCRILGDTDCDGDVDLADYKAFAVAFGAVSRRTEKRVK